MSVAHSIVYFRILSDVFNLKMQRKRRKSEDTEDKRICVSPLMFQTPVLGNDQKERQPSDFQRWGVDEVAYFLSSNGFDKHALKFREHEIEGRHLPSLDRQDLINMEIIAIGVQKDLLKLFSGLCRSERKDLSKVFNDPIHGHIELHPLLVKIIDTPQFQRLRYIKQLGGCYFVFPGASHNRFEHSIGVCHLAGELVETLNARQPSLGITNKDILCVKMAGLCHDLGHGPFSHLFDGLFIPEARPGYNWKHEDASVTMFDHLIEVNHLQSSFDQYGITDTDLVFVKEQIAGPIDTEQCSSQMQSDYWPYTGRGVEKGFLYEIVANKKNGIDVDKWDYFARDCHHLGIMINFDYHRFMKFVRVIPVDKRLQICTRDKEVANLYDMFHTRNTLHRRAYQHKTSNVIELMICEAFLKADDHLEIIGKNNKPVKLSQCIDDMYAYTNLNDHVFHQILFANNPKLRESQEILGNILKRKLYKCIGQTQPAVWTNKIPKRDHKRLASDIISSLEPSDLTGLGLPVLAPDNLLVDVVTFDYGMRSENPIDHVRFYLKHEPQKAVKVRKDQVSHMLPGRFTEQQVRVYCRRLDNLSLKAAWQYFINWCRNQDCITPKGAHMDIWDGNDSDVTPYNTPVGTPAKDHVTVIKRSDITPVKKFLSYPDDTS